MKNDEYNLSKNWKGFINITSRWRYPWDIQSFKADCYILKEFGQHLREFPSSLESWNQFLHPKANYINNFFKYF